MIRHMVLFSFNENTPEAARSEVLDGLRELPSKYSSILRFGLGLNISSRDRTFSHVMTMEFTTEAELEKYLKSEGHESFVRDRFRPNIKQRAIASYEVHESY
jgi:hypothetical protein